MNNPENLYPNRIMQTLSFDLCSDTHESIPSYPPRCYSYRGKKNKAKWGYRMGSQELLNVRITRRHLFKNPLSIHILVFELPSVF